MEIIGRLKHYWAWIASVALVAGAFAVVLATGPDAGDVETGPGRFVGASFGSDDRFDSGTLRFPLGTLTVGLTAPTTSADRYGLSRREAPDGGSFLGLRTAFDTRTGYAIATAGSPAESTPVLSLVVVADGRRYPVRQPATLPPVSYLPAGANVTGYLAVAGRPRDVTVEATLDGVRQTLRPSTGARSVGRAKELYRDTEPITRPRDCGPRRLTAGYRLGDSSYRSPDCTVTRHVRTAYVDGLGWAAPGKTWQLVYLTVGRQLDAERVVPGRPVQRYQSVFRDDDLAVRIDGRLSAGSPRANAGTTYGLDDDAVAAAEVPLDAPPVTVQIVSTYRRLARSGFDPDLSAPADPDVSVSWTETLS